MKNHYNFISFSSTLLFELTVYFLGINEDTDDWCNEAHSVSVDLKSFGEAREDTI
jgi:hypothetical protein